MSCARTTRIRGDCFSALRTFGQLVAFLLILSTAFASQALAADTSPEIKRQRDFVLANIEFTLLHEIAHVLIWELNLPVFGREEDAADNIAVIALLMLEENGGGNGVLDKLQSVAEGWKIEWRQVEDDQIDLAYWDLHSLEIQRFYNIACLVYGADPENREQVLQATALPADRAEFCHDEYAMAKGAMDWLLSQHSTGPVAAPSGVRHESDKKRGQVILVYDKNTSLDGEKLDTWLKESKIPEKLAGIVDARFDLPRDITISFEQCPFPNASWDVEKATIQFCYPLMNRFLYLAGEMAREQMSAIDNTAWNPETSASGAGQ